MNQVDEAIKLFRFDQNSLINFIRILSSDEIERLVYELCNLDDRGLELQERSGILREISRTINESRIRRIIHFSIISRLTFATTIEHLDIVILIADTFDLWENLRRSFLIKACELSSLRNTNEMQYILLLLGDCISTELFFNDIQQQQQPEESELNTQLSRESES